MRKFLKVAAIGALAILVATPAMALDFKFGAEYRVRLYSYVNNGFTDAVGSNPRGAQLRVRPRFDVTDDKGNIGATLRLEIGDVEFGNGGGASGNPTGFAQTPNLTGTNRVGASAGGALGADGVNVETKWAYMDFAMPFGWDKYGRVRAGIQPWFLSKGLIVDDDVAGIRAYGTIKPISYDFGWYRVAGGLATNGVSSVLVPCTAAAPVGGLYYSTAAACVAAGGVAGTPITVTGSLAAPTSNTADNNSDYFQGKVDLKLSPMFNPGLYYVYGQLRAGGTNDGLADGEASFFGLTVDGKLGIVNYDLDFVYGYTQGGPGGNLAVGTKGFALDGKASFPVGPVKISLAGTYATGDKRDGNNGEAFPWISPSWHGAGNGFELIGNGGAFDVVVPTQAGPTNLWMLGGWVDYVPVKALALKAAYGYAGFQKKDGNCAVVVAGSLTCFGPTYTGKGNALVGKSTLGHEVHFRADYTVWTNFKLQGLAGWLIPTAGEAETIHKYIMQMLYNF